MPATLTRGDRRLLLAGAAVVVLLSAGALLLGDRHRDDPQDPSSRSSGSGGTKAAYLLLQSLGYRVARWERPPNELTDAVSTTLIVSEPAETPSSDERRAIGRFLAAGGRVIATNAGGARLLSEAPARPDPFARTWTRIAATTPSAITRAAPTIDLLVAATWNEEAHAIPLYGDEDNPVVARLLSGPGDALWWASSTPITNAGLREAGNLEFVLASIGPADGRRVLFDEYFHGARQSLALSIVRSPAKWIGAQLALLMAIVLFTYARRAGPIMPSAPESRLAPLEFVRTLGSLYRRAGAASVAVDVSYVQFRFWLSRRLGISPNAPLDLVERTIRARAAIDPAELLATLRACEGARTNDKLSATTALGLVRALHAHSIALHLFPAVTPTVPSRPPSEERPR